MSLDVFILLSSIWNELHGGKRLFFPPILHRPLMAVRWGDRIFWFSTCRLSSLGHGDRNGEVSEVAAGAPSPAHVSFVSAEAALLDSEVVPCSVLVVIKQPPLTLPHTPAFSAARTKSPGWRPSVINHTTCHLADGETSDGGQIQLQHVCQVASPC